MEMTREQLGQFIIETRKNYGKSRLNFAKKISLTPNILMLVEMGSCKDDGLYIKVLAELLRIITPQKIKLEKIPAGLPNREELESMMSGNCDNQTLYTDVIQTLYKMPNLLPIREQRTIADNSYRKTRTETRKPKREQRSIADNSYHKISEQPANRNEIIYKWRRWHDKINVGCNIVNAILDMVDLNICKSDYGSYSNPKILKVYFRIYRIVNEQNKNNWLKCGVKISSAPV